MKTYIGKSELTTYCGGLHGCIVWAMEQVKEGVHVVKIHVARPGMKTARVIAEVTVDGVRHIRNGRCIPVRELRG